MKKTVTIISIILLILPGSFLRAQTFTNYTTINGLPDDFICGGVAIDTNDNKWFGTAAGVAKFDNTTWTVYDTADGVIDMFITCIAVDKNNNVWVGTNNGISKFNGTTWSSFTTTDGLVDNVVNYIAGDIDGSVWFSTFSGVSKYNGSTWTTYTTANGLSTNSIISITVDALGNKWFGTQMAGYMKYDNSTFTSYDTTSVDSLLDNNVFAIAVNQAGDRWIGTWYGMSRFNTSDLWVDNYRTADGLYNDFVRDIKIDSHGYMWIGMFADYNQDGGITRFNGNAWISFSVPEGLVNKQVIRLAIDKEDNLWVATGLGVSKLGYFSGLNEYGNNVFFNIFPNPASDNIYIALNDHAMQNVDVMNVMGEVIFSSKTDNSVKINTGNWADGMYVVRCGESSKKLIVRR